MAGVTVKLNSEGVRAILRSQAVLDVLEGIGEGIAERAGPGHLVSSRIGKNRARVGVYTATREAMIAEATDRNLTRAAGEAG